jgi:hypothetical protein
VTVVVCEVEPLLPVMVMVWFPVEALELTLTVIVDVPAPVIEVGLKVTVNPLPCPDAESAIAELKPPVTAVVIVDVPELLRAIVSDAGDAEIEKPPVPPDDVTVSEAVVVSTVLPDVPVTVTL